MSSPSARTAGNAALTAWLVTALYYFYQYMMRSAPAVMMPQLSEGFGLAVVLTMFLRETGTAVRQAALIEREAT